MYVLIQLVRKVPYVAIISGLSALYNGLSEVEDVDERVRACPGVIDKLVFLLVAHDLHRSYDIRLVHKHFDIGHDEMVVGFDGQSFKVSTVAREDGTLPLNVLSLHDIEPSANGEFVPTDFIINDNGVAVLYEFSYENYSLHISSLDEAFLNSWSSLLRANGLIGVLGLALQKHSYPIDAHEASDGDLRVNKLFFDGKMSVNDVIEYATTSWRVEKEEDGVVKADKCRYCTTIKKRHC